METISPDTLLARIRALPGPGRRIVALAGPPGGGKSTLAEEIVARLNAEAADSAALFPMDGYHYDDTLLIPKGWRPWKGAPHTFDVGGFRAMLARLRADEEDEIAVPVFDRAIEIARAGARLIPRSARVIVTEGNYLLLGTAPWAGLRPLFDLAAMVMVPEPELRDRLRARWQHYGLDAEAIRFKLDELDLPNGRRVYEDSRGEDVRVDGTLRLT